jgi:hypothetical protein
MSKYYKAKTLEKIKPNTQAIKNAQSKWNKKDVIHNVYVLVSDLIDQNKFASMYIKEID